MDILDKLINYFEEDNFHFAAAFLQAIKRNDFDNAIKLHDLMHEFYMTGNQDMIHKRDIILKELIKK